MASTHNISKDEKRRKHAQAQAKYDEKMRNDPKKAEAYLRKKKQQNREAYLRRRERLCTLPQRVNRGAVHHQQATVAEQVSTTSRARLQVPLDGHHQAPEEDKGDDGDDEECRNYVSKDGDANADDRTSDNDYGDAHSLLEFDPGLTVIKAKNDSNLLWRLYEFGMSISEYSEAADSNIGTGGVRSRGCYSEPSELLKYDPVLVVIRVLRDRETLKKLVQFGWNLSQYAIEISKQLEDEQESSQGNSTMEQGIFAGGHEEEDRGKKCGERAVNVPRVITAKLGGYDYDLEQESVGETSSDLLYSSFAKQSKRAAPDGARPKPTNDRTEAAKEVVKSTGRFAGKETTKPTMKRGQGCLLEDEKTPPAKRRREQGKANSLTKAKEARIPTPSGTSPSPAKRVIGSRKHHWMWKRRNQKATAKNRSLNAKNEKGSAQRSGALRIGIGQPRKLHVLVRQMETGGLFPQLIM
jgi:hypothetical protein